MTPPALDAQLLRGQVWAVDLPDVGEKFFVIVSNNNRNASRYPRVHLARLTARPQPPLPSIVRLDAHDFGGGYVLCDEVAPVSKDRLKRQVGVISPVGMRRVADAIKHVFSLP